ncbi:hypothetical protein [Microbispora catharanthi]|uniref:Uncharacterized protein n=1 Tax=Microbispora catharanthi TaxID=1712871 RepID=A0A5N6AZP1_9ACTN|nr:hypothetical protein [Microbispora catharanthi]KAB8174044.1 hypothetical protein FH610_041040 [Microbispora catharanthi]
MTIVVAIVAAVAFATPAGADTTWSVVPANANGPDGRNVIDKNAGKLHKSLDGVRKAEGQGRQGQGQGDKKVVTDTQVRATLLRDADALIVHYGGVRR